MKKIVHTLLMLCLSLWSYSNEASLKDSIQNRIPSGQEVYRHGYEELSIGDRANYDYIVRALLHFEPNKEAGYYHRVNLDSLDASLSFDYVRCMLERIQRDVPELYILGNFVPRSYYDETDNATHYYARITLSATPQNYLNQLIELDSIYNLIAADITSETSTIEKLKILHDGFIAWGDYGGMESPDAGNIKGAFIDKRAVCEGFSRAFLFLCQRAGLKCIFVSGQLLTNPESNKWGNHAWNFVEVDGQWYLMDLTTDGGFPNMCGYYGFLRGQDYFEENYLFTSSSGNDANLNGAYQALPPLAPTTYPKEDATQAGTISSDERCNLPLFNPSLPYYTLSGQPGTPNSKGVILQGGVRYFLK